MEISGRECITVFVMLCMLFIGVIGSAGATTITKPSERFDVETTPTPDSALAQESRTLSEHEDVLPSVQQQTTLPAWSFEWPAEQPVDPVPHARSLKSALLTITLNPQQFDPGVDLIGNQQVADDKPAGSRSFSAQATITVKLEVPENYTQEEIIAMFTASAKHLPIFDQETQGISAVELQVTTPPTSSFAGILVALIVVLTTIGIIGYTLWYRKTYLSHSRSAGLRKRARANYHLQDHRMAQIGQMTSTVIHDVKNAFTAIRSCAEVMADDDLDPLERKDFAQLIVNEIDRGVGMTQELLEFVRGQARSLQVQMYSANALVQETLAVIKQDFANRKIALHLDLRYAGAIQVDIEKMRRVFMNILTNARDAMPEGGVLKILSQEIGNRIEFVFSDTGCGMSPEVQARMFEPLFTAGKTNGTGLGMMIVKEILDAHHARIEVESAVGQGTTIHIFLPGQYSASTASLSAQ
ncbi:GAF sensor signal transduction histidine kinase [Candidatus Vecturithrix granuli]|uniref:histidine kinase n=1 Tax=Vecturithrix granuli TaxID=1499967 RepID=A0A081C088_VECG1|nr:GAF sensor signal transduction histidine kinase [Candidatus Vecturithrix granuli]